jgi:hypothetical protein
MSKALGFHFSHQQFVILGLLLRLCSIQANNSGEIVPIYCFALFLGFKSVGHGHNTPLFQPELDGLYRDNQTTPKMLYQCADILSPLAYHLLHSIQYQSINTSEFLWCIWDMARASTWTTSYIQRRVAVLHQSSTRCYSQISHRITVNLSYPKF